ncbi:hybrid sensor histidine kinase/response regulator [Salinigranum halophilum]|uniref:hybrid sensor histidine kinase/response regulator n=1 Tax=Salinigranum halophilum TaxID=2565931 RepID=UPI0010A90B3A|nr:ATP-binding protein [Salinigranum halophilum]
MTDVAPERILLVEDNESDARLIEEYLREEHWPGLEGRPELHRVERLNAALAEAGEEVDLVLLDLELPDSSGLETLAAMLDASGDEPVVVLTGLDDERVGIEAVERGAQDYVIKSDLTPKLLRRTLQYAVERERRERELARRNEELALLNRIVRHDIKNDVSVIIGWGDRLHDHVDPAGEEYLEFIINSGQHINGIAQTVGDFLEMLESDSDPDLHAVDLGRLLETEIAKIQSTHEEAVVTVDSALPHGIDVAATELLTSVFGNLLTNAVVHNDTDAPEVVVSVTVDPDTVTVRIADNGPGIPDSRKDVIFGRGEMGLESPGSGLGLYLVDTLVDIYDGSVHVEDRTEVEDSQGGEYVDTAATDTDGDSPTGSVFVVTLDRARDEPSHQTFG